MVLCTIIYSSFAVACIKIYGDTLSDGKFNVMNNINAMYKNDKTTTMFVLTLVLRTIFTCLLVFHVPFIFFISKESILIIFDEWTRGSIAKSIEDRSNNPSLQSEEQEEVKLDFENISDRTHHILTTALIIGQTILAIKFKFIFQIMPIVSSVAINCLDFVFPAVFYLMSAHKSG